MKIKGFYFSICLLLVAGFLFSCSQGIEPGGIKYNRSHIGSRTADKNFQFYSPKASANTLFWEDFEGAELTSKNPWESQNASLIKLSEVRNDLVENNTSNKEFYASLFGGSETKVAKLDAKYRTTSKLTYSNLNFSENCYLTLRYFFCWCSWFNI